MKAKPGSIILLAVLQLLAPIGNIWSGAVLSKNYFFQYSIWLKAHDPYFLWSHAWIPLIAAFAIYSTKIWSLPVFLFTLAWNFGRIQIATAPHVTGWAKFLPYAAVAINAGLFIFICLPQVRKVYLDKRIRWWESTPRYFVNWSCKIESAFTHLIQASIDQYSSLGVFVSLRPEDSISMKLGEVFNLVFEFENKKFSLQAKAVNRMATNQNQFGLTFVDVKMADKLQLWLLSQTLERRGIERRPIRVSHFKEFLKWPSSLIK